MKEEIIKHLLENGYSLIKDEAVLKFQPVYTRETETIYIKEDNLIYRKDDADYCIFSYKFIEQNKDLVFNYVVGKK